MGWRRRGSMGLSVPSEKGLKHSEEPFPRGCRSGFMHQVFLPSLVTSPSLRLHLTVRGPLLPNVAGTACRLFPSHFSCGEAPAHHEARPVKGPEGSGALHALAELLRLAPPRTQNSLQHVAPRSSHRHGSSGRSFIAPLQLQHSHACSILSSTCRWQPAGHSHIILLRWRGPKTDLPGSMEA